ncbi:MAG: hypothetical protein HN981_04085 [Candidatus Pacebacteria bacterium]|jgi:ribulose-phosphate 3-epimerase|nr:hypothetical protein [Candidatus Paceibacterota bacterium]MBT4652426.1 hypothetical protein [Candidatus Paceibacterota bacterium]MBT6756253.1 hypothetical protein [Candidatus Paceibacterota bacterium]MBT6921544.1 hypothetical protein [Candidatus Paceibacterota bacterium]
MKIYPAILSDSIEEIQKQVDLAKSCSSVEILQIDIIDGFFADNITVSPQSLLEVDFGDLQIDLHLMVDEPMDMISEIENLENNLPIRTIIAQIEKMTYQKDFVEDVKKMGYKVGLSLDIYTPVDSLDEDILSEISILQFMGIEAGFQGQKLIPQVFEKIKLFVEADLVKNDQDLSADTMEITFDGGVIEEHAEKLDLLGVTSLVVGSLLWKSEDFCEQYQKLAEI